MLPADLRLLSLNELTVDEAALSGEPYPARPDPRGVSRAGPATNHAQRTQGIPDIERPSFVKAEEVAPGGPTSGAGRPSPRSTAPG